MKNQWINVSALMSGGLVSLCCGVPLALAVLGIGGLGMSSYIGEYHWYLTGAGILALAIGWGLFMFEKKKAENMGARLDNERFTKSVLFFVTLLVIVFSSLSVYSQLKEPDTNAITQNVQGKLITIGVKGMTCASCELTIQRSLHKLDGVHRAIASTKKGTVIVDYDPAKCNPAAIMKAINQAGYKTLGII